MDEQLTLFGSPNPFDAIRQVRPDGSEYWSARDLAALLSYSDWRNFEEAIERAKLSCEASHMAVSDHFGDATKVIEKGRWGSTTIADFHLSRYGAYLTAMNGDPRKPEIGAAQTYFAVKTREREIEQTPPLPTNFAEALRLAADLYEQNQAKDAALKAKDATIAVMAPKVEFFNHVADSKDCMSVSDAAKVLGTGQNRLFRWLKGEGLLMEDRMPYQEYLDRGYFRVIEQTWEGKSGKHVTPKTLVTARGFIYIQNKFQKKNT